MKIGSLTESVVHLLERITGEIEDREDRPLTEIYTWFSHEGKDYTLILELKDGHA